MQWSHFVKATYNLEGDGPLAVRAYQELRVLDNFLANWHYPNVMEAARAVSRGNAEVAQGWINYARQCMQPAYNYYQEKFIADEAPLRPLVMIFKSCQIFDPAKAMEMQPNIAMVAELSNIPFLNSVEVIQELQLELPTYLALA